MTSSEASHLASGPSSVISGGQDTFSGMRIEVLMMRPKAHPLLESAAKRMKPRVVSRKKATGGGGKNEKERNLMASVCCRRTLNSLGAKDAGIFAK